MEQKQFGIILPLLFLTMVIYNHLATQPFLGYLREDSSEFSWINYETCFKRVEYLAGGLVQLGLLPGMLIGSFGTNCPEFHLLALALHRQSLDWLN